jgi:hypothetical protein
VLNTLRLVPVDHRRERWSNPVRDWDRVRRDESVATTRGSGRKDKPR